MWVLAWMLRLRLPGGVIDSQPWGYISAFQRALLVFSALWGHRGTPYGLLSLILLLCALYVVIVRRVFRETPLYMPSLLIRSVLQHFLSLFDIILCACGIFQVYVYCIIILHAYQYFFTTTWEALCRLLLSVTLPRQHSPLCIIFINHDPFLLFLHCMCSAFLRTVSLCPRCAPFLPTQDHSFCADSPPKESRLQSFKTIFYNYLYHSSSSSQRTTCSWIVYVPWFIFTTCIGRPCTCLSPTPVWGCGELYEPCSAFTPASLTCRTSSPSFFSCIY